MDADRFRSLAETAPADLRQKLVTLPGIIAEWVRPHGGLAGRKIMDFGCGLGELAAGLAFAEPSARVIGVEVTDQPSGLPGVLERVGLAPPPNLSFREVALGEVGDEDGFDLIVSWSVFEHIQRNQFDAVMARLKTRLKPGGLLFMQVSPLFFSPEGSHFWALGYTDWQHLTRELSEVREDLDASALNARQRELHWKLFLRLNRFTAPDFERRLTAAGYSVLRRQIDRTDREPPAELLTAYDREALQTEQIVLLLRRD
ncbi:class I SAM-dependent methyltransferase [Brevundimonas bacteroides]|uniref:class I SAM-dependent methyltransferase n=1 Tax=Brevundimonas bacteroides TaxID=74311 RepID=UPI0004982B32|nr:class I SAM-dependent methyltransferase [Brevundimonas bacteroides]